MKNDIEQFLNPDYLKFGNPSQIKAHKLLQELNIFEELKAYNPLLAGTVPIALDISSSDLDILCSCEDLNQFAFDVSKLYQNFKGFNYSYLKIRGIDSCVARFFTDSFPIEIFAQNQNSRDQDAFKHMIIEYQILQEKGDDFKSKLIQLKKAGLKTEPAFAKLLGLTGDPYEALLNYGK